jgi:PAS domain S-box-containing protein
LSDGGPLTTTNSYTGDPSPEVRILILENSPADAEHLKAEILRAGMPFIHRCVDNRDAFVQTLRDFKPGVVLAACMVPGFDGLSAVKFMRLARPDIPVIIVSEVMGDEKAVELLTAGAKDYVLKDRLARLVPAIQRAITEVRVIRERRQAKKKLLREAAFTNFMLSLYEKAQHMTDNDLYAFVLDQSVRLTGSAIGFLHLVSADRKSIALTMWNSEALKNCTASYETHYPIEQAGNWIDCLRLNRPVVYNDYLHSPNQKGFPEGHVPIRRFMSVPVVQEGSVGMVFCVGNKFEEYDEQDVSQLLLVANGLREIMNLRFSNNALAESEQRYRAIFENAAEGICRSTPDGKFVNINPAMAHMYGYDSPTGMIESVVDMGIQLWEHPEERAKYVEELEKHGSTNNYEHESRKKDGSLIWVSLSARAVKDPSGRTIYHDNVVEDITSRKLLDLELNEHKRILEGKNRELESAYEDLQTSQQRLFQQDKMASIGQLAAGVAHEINNPIGFIMSNLNSLSKYVERLATFMGVQADALDSVREKSEELKSAADRVTDQKRALKVDYILEDLKNIIGESLEGAERVKQIVQDLKGFSHTDEAEFKSADINQGLESTINIVWNELKYKATVAKEYGEIPPTKCNPGQLNQVFMNLLVNAAHAIEKQGKIKVKTWQENSSIAISIADTGCGIPQDKLNRIYEPFFTTKEVGKGTGLGLSIAYDIVEKHGGEISVESEVGKGTEFTIKIPIVEG